MPCWSGCLLGDFEQEGYANAAWGIRPEQATWALRTLDAAQGDLEHHIDSRPPHPVYRYEKHHLVPFLSCR